MLGFILGLSLAINIITIIILIFMYKKLLKNNPLSFLNDFNEKKYNKNSKTTNAFKKLTDMEYWDI